MIIESIGAFPPPELSKRLRVVAPMGPNRLNLPHIRSHLVALKL